MCVCVRVRERKREGEREKGKVCVFVSSHLFILSFIHIFIHLYISILIHPHFLIIFESFLELGGANIGVILSAIFPSTLCIILGLFYIVFA